MADYINKNILVQAYVHFERPLSEISDQERSEIELRLQTFTNERASFFLAQKVDVEVDLNEGSIKGKISVFGYVALLYTGALKYKDFRESTALIYSDAKRLSELIVSEGMFNFDSRTGDSLRVEARVGIIGSLQKINAKIEAIRKSSPNSDLRRTNQALDDVTEDIVKLLSLIKSDEDLRVVKKGLKELSHNIPKEPRKPDKGSHPSKDIAIYRRRRENLTAAIEQQELHFF